MGRVPRAPRRIAGVPITKETGKNLAGAAIDIVLGRSVDDKIAKERLEKCMKCEVFDGSRCGACGCFMRSKVGLPTAYCPLGKWNR